MGTEALLRRDDATLRKTPYELSKESGPDYPGDVVFYGVVSAQTEKVVGFFLEREAAETMIGEVREDEPALAVDLRVEAVELG